MESAFFPLDRRAWPLFGDPEGLPLLGSDMDRALRDALMLYHPQVAATRSWHSYRIRLASKLRAACTPSGTPAHSDAVIQALLRWKTSAPSNLRIIQAIEVVECALSIPKRNSRENFNEVGVADVLHDNAVRVF
jgi:hypothetical protein